MSEPATRAASRPNYWLSSLSYALGEAVPIAQLKQRGVDESLLETMQATGLDSVRCFAPDLTTLAKDAIAKTLRDAQLAPETIDAVVWTSASLIEDFAPTGKAFDGKEGFDVFRKNAYRVMAELGLQGAYPLFTGFGGCANLASALAAATGAITTGMAERVLVVTTDRIPDSQSRVLEPGIALLSDGAACCLVTREPRAGYVLKALSSHADNSLWNNQITGDFARYLVSLGKALKQAGSRYFKSTGSSPKDHAWLVLNNYTLSTLRLFAAQLGMPSESVYRDNVARVSHVATGDGLINLSDLWLAGKPQHTDRLLVFGSGPSSWSCIQLETDREGATA
jgi:3-oxoacyl-[acyl-carrier-protein] synthase-3